MSERINLGGEQYHIDRAKELGMPIGTGKRYSEENLDRFISKSEYPKLENIKIEFYPETARPLAKAIVGGYFIGTIDEMATAGVDVDDPEMKLSVTATALHRLATVAYNPNPLIETNLFSLLSGEESSDRFDIILGLLGEYTAELSVEPLDKSKKHTKKQIAARDKDIAARAAEHTDTYQEIARFFNLNDSERVNQITKEIAAIDSQAR